MKRPEFRTRGSWALIATCAAGAVVTFATPASAQLASWIGPVSGFWNDGSKWSTAPQFPNSPTSTARINAAGAPYTVTNDAVISINQLTLSSPDATLRLQSGSLYMDSGATISNGSIQIAGGSMSVRIGAVSANFNLSEAHVSMTSGGWEAGSFRMTGDSDVLHSGGRFSAAGAATFENGAYTFSGGTMSFGLGGVFGVNGGSVTFHQTGGIIEEPSNGMSIGSTQGRATALIEGPSSRINLHSSGAAIGGGTNAQGTMTVRNGASVTFGSLSRSVHVGISGGTGTLLIDTGARFLAGENMGIGTTPAAQHGSGTVILRGDAQLTVGGAGNPWGQLHIGGNGGLLRVEGGTLTTVGFSSSDHINLLNANARFEIAGGSVATRSVIVNGQLEKSGGLLQTQIINVTGSGQLTHSGGSLTASGVQVSGGAAAQFTGGEVLASTLNVSSSAQTTHSGGSFTSGNMLITGGATAQYTGGALDAGSIFIDTAALLLSEGGDKVLRATALTITGTGGRLDLSDNAMAISDGQIASVRSLIATGHAGGTWMGDGLTSSAAAANPGYALGYATASALPVVPAIFGSVDGSTLLIRYTRYGDSDLNGQINLEDFNRLAANFGSTNAVWSQGDFTYDGVVNLDDFNRLAANFGLSASPDGPTPDDWSALAAAVPEPTALTCAAALWPAIRRRRRHVTRLPFAFPRHFR